MDNPATQHPRSGPWDGVDESGLLGAGKVRDAFNVVFGRDGLTRRRPGRRIVAVDAEGRRVAGLHQRVNRLGQREILAYLDSTDLVDGGLFLLNWNTGAVEALAGESAALLRGGSSVAVNLDGNLILADPDGTLRSYDGTEVAAVAAEKGTDASLDVGYLSEPPAATELAIWRDKLVAAAGARAPRLIGLSENKWAPTIPDEAPLGAANVWPARTNFDLSTEQGDIITGLTVHFDRLAVFGRTGVGMVDEDAVSPYVRNLAQQYGCIAPRSVVNIGDRVLYLGDGDVLVFDGTRPGSIGGLWLQKTLTELVDWDCASGAVGVNFRRDHEYRLWVPVKGLPGNQLCLIYNYERKTWRKASHWPLFDIAARRDLPYRFDVTCALAAVLENGREVLLTGDSAGNVWIEDVGEDDEGQVFPAFIALDDVENGAEPQTFRDWFVECVHDGAFVAGIGVIDGRELEQEVVRVLAGEAIEDVPFAKGRALTAGHLTWDDATVAWPMSVIGPKRAKLKLGIEGKGRSIQVVLLMLGRDGATVDPTPGGIRQIEIAARAKPGRR